MCVWHCKRRGKWHSVDDIFVSLALSTLILIIYWSLVNGNRIWYMICGRHLRIIRGCTGQRYDLSISFRVLRLSQQRRKALTEPSIISEEVDQVPITVFFLIALSSPAAGTWSTPLSAHFSYISRWESVGHSRAILHHGLRLLNRSSYFRWYQWRYHFVKSFPRWRLAGGMQRTDIRRTVAC